MLQSEVGVNTIFKTKTNWLLPAWGLAFSQETSLDAQLPRPVHEKGQFVMVMPVTEAQFHSLPFFFPSNKLFPPVAS